MKKMWKKNNKAVSPVIATILMVAITVVLAAVLYVMVMGFGGDSGGQAPTASLKTSGNRLVLSLTGSYEYTDTSLQVKVGSAAKTNFAEGVFAGTNVTFVDAGDDNKVSNQDYFTKTGTTPVLIQIIWNSGGTSQVIAEGTL